MEVIIWIAIIGFAVVATEIFGRYTPTVLFVGVGFLIRSFFKLRAENRDLKQTLERVIERLSSQNSSNTSSASNLAPTLPSDIASNSASDIGQEQNPFVSSKLQTSSTVSTNESQNSSQPMNPFVSEKSTDDQKNPFLDDDISKATSNTQNVASSMDSEVLDRSYRPTPRTEPNQLTVALQSFFSTGNLFAKIGSIILFFGVSFLLKIVADQGYFPLEARLIASAAIAMALIGLGWRIRSKNALYSVTLQGAGFGIFYLTVFASFRLWSLIPSSLAIGFLVAATVIFSTLAVLQNASSLAILAVLGGFSAPILISTGSNNFVALFSYYALLNTGILFISRFKAWKHLNLVGFVCTYIVGAMWGAEYYKPEYFRSIEPFLIFHFLLYTIVALQFARPMALMQPKTMVDTTLVFGVPIATFALQSKLVQDFEYGMAISAICFGGFYVMLAWFLYRKVKDEMRPLVESFLGSGICFTLLAVPFAVSNTWTSAVWSIQGALLFWVGIRQSRPLARYSGMLLQFLAAVAFYFRGLPNAEFEVMFSPILWGSLMIAGSCFFIGFQIFRKKDSVGNFEVKIVGLFLLGAIYWWLVGGLSEIQRLASFDTVSSLRWMFAGLSFFGFYLVSKALAWPLLGFARYGMMLVFALGVGRDVFDSEPVSMSLKPFANVTYISLLLLSVSALFISHGLAKYSTELKAWERHSKWAFLLAGFYWWTGSHFIELQRLAQKSQVQLLSEGLTVIRMEYPYWLMFLAASALMFRFLSLKLKWLDVDKYSYLVMPIAAIIYLRQWYLSPSLPILQNWSLFAWVAIFVTHFALLRMNERREASFSKFMHFSGLWLLSLVIVKDAYGTMALFAEPNSIWPMVVAIALLDGIVLGILFASEKVWPFLHKKSYVLLGVAPHLLYVFISTQTLSLSSAGNANPLPFIPLLNPLDLMVAFSLLVIVSVFIKLETYEVFSRSSRPMLWTALVPFVFLFLTMALIRSIHQLASVPWSFDALFGSNLVQMSLTIFWGILALSVTLVSHRKKLRAPWILGSSLIAIVVLKLFIIDLKNSGSMERVVSFIGTGVLLLLIGYFAPIPTSERKSEVES